MRNPPRTSRDRERDRSMSFLVLVPVPVISGPDDLFRSRSRLNFGPGTSPVAWLLKYIYNKCSKILTIWLKLNSFRHFFIVLLQFQILKKWLFLISSPCPVLVLGPCPGPGLGPGPSPGPGPNLVPVLGPSPSPIIILVPALVPVPVPSYFWSWPWSRFRSKFLFPSHGGSQ